MGNSYKPQVAAIRESGRHRLMLRIPQYRSIFAASSGENFLDLCEAYELAWVALEYWAQTDPSQRDDIRNDYKELVMLLEREAVGLVGKCGQQG